MATAQGMSIPFSTFSAVFTPGRASPSADYITEARMLA